MQLKNLVAATVLAATPALAQDCLQFANTPPGTNLMLSDDQTVSLPLPFAFPFNGTTFDAISICSNGYVWLGIETDDDFSDTEAEFLSEGPRIAPCWDDLEADSTAVPAGGGIFFNQSATQVNVVFKDIPYWGSTTEFVNMEVVLTAGGTIHLHYEANHFASTSTSIVGITAGGGAASSPLDLSSGPSITGATGYELFAASTMDLVGTTQSLVPTGPSGYVVATQTLPTCAPTQGPNLSLATTSDFGAGCPSPVTGTWYEAFTTSTLDLNGMSLRLIAAGNNLYAVTPGAGFDTTFGPGDAVVLADDGQINVSCAAMGGFPFQGNTLTAIDMVSNGFFWLAPNVSNDFSPSAAEFANFEARVAPCWMDLNPSATTGGGTVYWTETAAFSMGTWEDVPTFGNTGTAMNTFQCKFFPNGDIEMSWVTVDNNATVDDNAIVGVSGGFSNPTPAIDVSTFTMIFDVTPDLTTALSHVADTLPIIGTSYDITTLDAPVGSLFGATFVGFSQLNIDLTAFGAPGCFQYADNLAVFFNVLNGAQTFTNSIPIPFDLSLVGIAFVSQGAIYEPSVNVLGVNSSNGTIGTIGL